MRIEKGGKDWIKRVHYRGLSTLFRRREVKWPIFRADLINVVEDFSKRFGQIYPARVDAEARLATNYCTEWSGNEFSDKYELPERKIFWL